MDKWDKAMRKALRAELDNCGGEVFAFADEGVTVVVVPSAGQDSAFARVAVAQCDFVDDSFKRKRGELIALERWQNGESIAVRVNDREFDEIAETVLDLIV